MVDREPSTAPGDLLTPHPVAGVRPLPDNALMRTDVDAFLCRLAQELRPRTDESVDAMLRNTHTELPELWRYDEIAALAAEETAGHVTAFLDALEHGLDAAEVAAPPQSVELARRFARNGVPISTLLRAYRLGHVALLQLIQAEAPRLTDDPELINAAALRLMAAGFAYVDRGSVRVVSAYQEERDRRLQRRLILANEAGRRIGTTLDIGRTAQELADVGTDDFAGLVTVDLLVSVVDDEDPSPPSGPSLLRRVAQRSVPGDGTTEFPVPIGRTHTYPAESESAHALATGTPVLHRVGASDFSYDERGGPASGDFHSVLLLPLLARGETLGLVQFLRTGGSPLRRGRSPSRPGDRRQSGGVHRQRPPVHPRAFHSAHPPAQPAAAARGGTVRRHRGLALPAQWIPRRRGR